MSKLSGALTVFSLLAASSLANATPVTFLLAGQLPETQTQIWSGEPWLAYLTIDDVPRFTAANGGERTYIADSRPFGMALTLPGVGRSGLADSVRILVSNDAGGVFGPIDYIWIRASGGTFGSADYFFLDMFWADAFVAGTNPSQTDAMSSADLSFPPSDRFSQYCFAIGGCQLRIGDSNNAAGYLTFENLSVTRLPFVIPVPERMPVPEPNSTGLLCLGLAAVLFARRPVHRLRQ